MGQVSLILIIAEKVLCATRRFDNVCTNWYVSGTFCIWPLFSEKIIRLQSQLASLTI